jgi:hemin uptake protein HemP
MINDQRLLTDTRSPIHVTSRYSMTSESPQEIPPSTPARPVAPREINSADLMRGDREIIIRHGEELYRLNVTRSGKLILRK